MMTVYVAGRQAGKTVFLIQQSARTGALHRQHGS